MRDIIIHALVYILCGFNIGFIFGKLYGYNQKVKEDSQKEVDSNNK